VKNNFVLGRCDYHYRHETILYGWKDGAHYFVDEHNHSSVFEVPKPHRADLHPTMKPTQLIAQMVRNSSKPGEIVYDPFGGSGSTLIACEELGRHCRTIELAPGYADVILARWEKLTGDTATRINSI
jgi:DNA modification methylase